MILELAKGIALYSASFEDFDTQLCFLHFHETIESSKNIHQLVVELRVLGHQAQLA